MNTGQARREDLLLRSQDSPLRRVWKAERPAPRVHRPIHEDAGGLTARIAEDLSVGGEPWSAGRRRPGGHGLGIGPSRVPIHPTEPDRSAGRDRIEHGSGGKGIAWPAKALVPVSPRDPGVAGNGLDPRLHEATSSSDDTPRRSTCSRLDPSHSTCP